MAAMSKKSPKRGLDQQLAEVSKLQQRIGAGELLDIDSKEPLLIDAYVKDYGKGDKKRLRSAVARIGQEAVYDVIMLYHLPNDARDMGERAIQAAAKVDEEARWLRSLDDRDLFILGMAFQVNGGNYGGLEFYEMVNALKEANKYFESVQKHFELNSPLQTGRSEILARIFVERMRAFHERQNGCRPPMSKSGRFVDFMQAAWLDLRFPRVAIETLAYMAERDYRIRRSN